MMKFPNVVLPDTGPMAYADVGASLEKVGWSRGTTSDGFATRGAARS